MDDLGQRGADKSSDRNSENNRRFSGACLMDNSAQDLFKSMSRDQSKSSNQSLGLPNLQLDMALNFKPAEKGTKAYADWQEKAKERSNAALDPNCKNETTVQKGDSLWGVAERSMKEKGGSFSKKDVLAEMNKIIEANKEQYPWIEKNPNFLKEGMKLKLPETQNSRGSESSTATEERNSLGRSESSRAAQRTESATATEERNSLARSESNKAGQRVESSTATEERNLAARSESNNRQGRKFESSTSVEERTTQRRDSASKDSSNSGANRNSGADQQPHSITSEKESYNIINI